MKRISLLIFVFFAFGISTKASVCSVSDTQIGTDQSGTTATVSNFSCVGSNLIISATLDASIGPDCQVGGGNKYYYDIIVNGVLIATAQCNQTAFDLSPYLPLNSVSITAVDDPTDLVDDPVTLVLNVDLTYFPPVGVSCLTGSSSIIFSDDLESNNGWTGDIGTSPGNWRLPNLNPGGNSGGTGPSSAQSGFTYAEFEASAAASGTYSIVSPIIDLTTANDQAELSFWMHAFGSNMGTLNIGVANSPSGPFTNLFSCSGQYQTSATDAWANIGVDLTAYIGQTIYLEFSLIHHGSGIEGDFAIDLIEVTTCITCPSPTALTASNINDSSVELNWIPGGTETAWVIEYGPVGFLPGTGNLNNATTFPFVLNGLNPTTEYDIYILADCGSGDQSLLEGPLQITTQIADLSCGSGQPSYLYLQDFESGFPIEWSHNSTINPQWTYNTGQTNTAATGPIMAQNNTGYIYFETSGGTFGDTDTLYSPMIDLSLGIDAARIIFYYHMFGATTGDLSVDVSTDQLNWTTEYTLSGEIQTAETDSWLPAEIDVTAYTGSQIWVRLVAKKGSSFTGDISIDNFQVEACVSCPSPTLLDTLVVTETSVDLLWLAGGSESNWAIEYGNNGFVPGTGTLLYSSTNPTTVSSLIDNTGYDFYVYAICGASDTSVCSGPFSVTTDMYCPAPTAFNFEYASGDTVALEWIIGGNESAWNVEWGTSGFVPGTTVGTTNTTTNFPDTIISLPLGGVWDFYVQADCGLGINNPWTGPIVYATAATNDDPCMAISVPVDGSTTMYSNNSTSLDLSEPVSGYNTVWFTFIAPTSGNLSISTCGNDFNNFLEVYKISDCSDFSTYSYLDGANGNPFTNCSGTIDPAGINLCGLLPGSVYYLVIGSEVDQDEGIFPLTLTEIIPVSVGTAVPQTACENNNNFDLFSLINANTTTNGQWYETDVLAANLINNPISLLGNTGLNTFWYVDSTACNLDQISITLDVVPSPNVGVGTFLPLECNFGDINLDNELLGLVDPGGDWYDQNANIILPLISFNGDPAGLYSYYYVVDNGICPTDSSSIDIQLIDCATLDEKEIVLNVYPNPVKENLKIELKESYNEVKIELYTTQGKRITNLISSNNSEIIMNLSGLTAGMYILQLTTDEIVKEIRIAKE